ncbi:MAG: MBL fold metallo-hydrolase [Cyclobacteriaceae bacterium]|nr:MAG: MBL fold metallo-hydrolase [Cyclobacteriaceae bacterium]
MIKPYLQGDALLKSISTAEPGGAHFALWWLGQSGFLIKWQHHYLLLDPYLSDSLTLKYAQTDKPHVRMTERVIHPTALDFIDVVTSSHNHTDHLDAATLIPLISVNPGLKMVIPEANRSFVCERINCAIDYPVGMSDGTTRQVQHFKFHGIPAAHNELKRNSKGECHYLGYVIEFGPWTVYHSGDTLWYQGMEDLLKPFKVDLALLPINGNKPERRVAGNLDYSEAPRLAQSIGAKLVIPCHYEMFTFNTADPADFKKEADRLGQPAQILACGQPWNSGMIPSGTSKIV